jgi:undecaprenyl-diphosphatase
VEQILIALFLGMLEGITEFLPISSTGHLILFIDLLKFQAPEGKVFEVVIQLGAILAVCLVFHSRVTDVMLHLHDRKETRRFVYLIALAFLPSAIIGFLAHGFIKSVLFSPLVVAVMLIVGGILILIIERAKPEPSTHHVDDMTPKQALLVGLCQAIAMIPGTSRSGATMMGSLLMGIDRKCAAEFSFLLAIPTMLAATAYDLYKNWHYLSADDAMLIGTGFTSAFVSAFLAVRWLMRFLSNHSFVPFAYYRIAFGIVMLVWLYPTL